MVRIRQAALFVVVAALPLPFLLSAGLVWRQDLFWLFISDLAVAIVASAWSRRPMGEAPGRWSFESRARRGSVGSPDLRRRSMIRFGRRRVRHAAYACSRA
jgi:hypothetical protein